METAYRFSSSHHGLKAQLMQRKKSYGYIIAVLLDKIPLPELRLPSSRSSSQEPRFVDRSPRKWPAAPSGECRAGSPWFRRRPIRSHRFFPSQRVALQQRSVAKVCLQTKCRLARNPWNLNFGWKSTKHRLELRIHRLSRLKVRKRMKLARMNTHKYDFIPSSGMEGSAGWAGAWVQKKPRLRMLLQLQTLSALQVTLNYPFVQWNRNKTTFIPMPGCVTNVTWSVAPACASGCPSSRASS